MENKYRHEFKYVITEEQLVLLRQRLCGLMRIDSHAGPGGSYLIRSLYFDDLNDRCYYENLDGTDPREKFRIRIYNASADFISLECKRKERQKTLKTSCILTEEQCRALMRGEALPDIASMPPVLRKLTLQMLTAGMRPKVIVEYERVPFVYDAGNVRVTLDMRLCSSPDVSSFLEKDISKRPVMPKGLHLLEVKWDEFIPDEIFRACGLDGLTQTAYSKYFLCRQYSLK